MIQEIGLQNNNSLGLRKAGRVDKETIQTAIDPKKLELNSSLRFGIYQELLELAEWLPVLLRKELLLSFLI